MPTADSANSLPVVPAHGRKLGILGVSLTKARLPKGHEALLTSVRDELESTIEATGYLKDAPFSWVTVALRFGLKDDVDPNYLRVSKKHGDLPLSIKLDISHLQGKSPEDYRCAYRRAAARALYGAGLRHRLNEQSVLVFHGLADLPINRAGGDA